jgi:hypothetical protein
MNDSDQHAKTVGQLIGQLQSVEFLLRWWLAKLEDLDVELPHYVGQILSETPITDYRSLSQLIASYNSQLCKTESGYQVDTRIVDLRDALAHGRVLALDGENYLTLYRFDRPVSGQVNTRAITALSAEALAADIELVVVQFTRVLDCGTKRGYFD